MSFSNSFTATRRHVVDQPDLQVTSTVYEKMHKFHKQRKIGCKVGFSGPIPRGLTSPCILLYYIEHSVFNQAVRGAPMPSQSVTLGQPVYIGKEGQ